MKKIAQLCFVVILLIISISCTKKTTPTTPTVSTTWTLAKQNPGYEARVGYTTVVFNDKMWFMCGNKYATSTYYRDVWNSSDGVTWQCVTGTGAPQGSSYRTLTFNAGTGDKIWLFSSNQIYNSADGTIWPQVITNTIYSPRGYFNSVSFDNGNGNKMYIIGGVDNSYSTYYNDVWSSSNGTDWTCVTTNAGFSPRSSEVILKYDNGTGEKLWLISGVDFTKVYNDVWSSTNGKDWILVTSNASFPSRYGATGFVYNNKMWIVSGIHTMYGFPVNDAWYSSDGANWTRLTDNAFDNINCLNGLSPESQVYNNKAWLIFCDDRSSTNQLWNY